MAMYLDGTEISSRNQTTQPFQPSSKGRPNPERMPSTPLRTPVTCGRSLFVQGGCCWKTWLQRELEDFSSRTGTVLDESVSGMPVAYLDASSFREDHLNNHVSESTSLALSSVVTSSWEEFNNAVGDWRQRIWASTWQWYPESLRCVRVWCNSGAQTRSWPWSSPQSLD